MKYLGINPTDVQNLYSETYETLLKEIKKEDWTQKSPNYFEKELTRRFTLYDFEIYYKATVIKTVWYYYKKYMQIKSPEIY